MNLERKGQMLSMRGCCGTSHTFGGGSAGRQGKDCCSDGEGMAEGFQDRAIPLGREKLGGINSAIWEGLGFVWTTLTGN